MKSKRDILLGTVKITQVYGKQVTDVKYKQKGIRYNRVVLPVTPERTFVLVDGKILDHKRLVQSLVRDGYVHLKKNDKIEVEPLKIIKKIGKTTYEI